MPPFILGEKELFSEAIPEDKSKGREVQSTSSKKNYGKGQPGSF